MTLRVEAVARTGPTWGRDACALAGRADVWFDTAVLHHGGGVAERVAAASLPPAIRDRLSAPRPDVCGLTLDRPRIMGILNVTPDSFSDGGELASVAAAVARAQAMAGTADILDIGGESTRPGAETIAVAEEIRRTAPVIRAIREAGIATPISIDTRKAAVADAALAAGADMVNDVSALTHDPAMAALVAERDVPLCLMHNRGDPATMQDDPRYADVLFDVLDALENRVHAAVAAGIRRENLIIDPGIGFGKTLQHNVTLLRRLALYHDLGLPLLLGASRKRFIGTISGAAVARDRVAGSVAVALHGVAQGMHILRVHDTTDTRQALSLQAAMIGTGTDDA
ncbi:dihydropteroate synthase [Fertoebacter nigrum]|uniref:Dihydropteroate synthase n=1 Tax=Fertoeibacter niger TaxID=2656921 RepID=A0A8X8H2T1_9RHOB|nr:dihydropteroate synthase [Fertoeibacter niger]NUB45152.1 dihydropteroate synthase [Fertoeibacter niger]